MNSVTSSAIDVVEFVYDLDVNKDHWVPSLLEVGLPLLDHGHGVVGATYVRPPEGGIPFPTKFHQLSGPPDLMERVLRASTLANEEVLREINRSGVVTTLSETVARFPGAVAPLEEFQLHLADAKDILALTAVDPNGVGMSLTIPLPEVTQLSGRDRELWQMIGTHLVSGFRLRQGLEEEHEAPTESSSLPRHAEAVLDPKRFEVAEAIGRAKDKDVGGFLREAAIQIDRARGLTEREAQVCTYVSLGESNKLISYRLGVSQPLVSAALKSAMRKLGVRTRPQLVDRLRGFQSVASGK